MAAFDVNEQTGESPATPPPAAGASPAVSRMPVFWMALCLAVALGVIKAFHFELPVSWNVAQIWIYVRNLLIATAADNLFALVVGIVAAVNMAILPRRAAGRPYAMSYWVLFCTLCVEYGVVNGYVFAFAKSPITHDLIASAGKWENLRSSLVFYIDATTITALCAGPLAYLLCVWALHRYAGSLRWRNKAIVVILLIAAVGGQYLFAAGSQRWWSKRDDRRIASNPPWALFCSYVLGRPDNEPHYPSDFPAAYLADFQTINERNNLASAGHDIPPAHRPRNVIVFVMESTSTQFLHLYGSRFATTPVLDSEAANSVVFDQFYSHVGLTPSALVEISNSNYARLRPLAEFDSTTLRQPGAPLSLVLKSHGFRTLAITSAYFRFARQREFLEACSFDQIVDAHDLPGNELTSWGKADAPMTDKILKWIDADPGHTTPFFAACWTNQTHHPYRLPPDQRALDLIGDFRPPSPANPPLINQAMNCILEADRQIGRLLTGLRQRGLADDTLVVITADHGEAMNYPHHSAAHGHHVYEEQVHIPCIFWNPRLFSPGRRLSTPGGHIDLAPTIAEIMGIEPAGAWQGQSLFDSQRIPRIYFCGIMRDSILGVREGDWKYIYNASTGFDELYNLRLDPQEANDVFADHPDICHDMRQRIAAWAHHLQGIKTAP